MQTVSSQNDAYLALQTPSSAIVETTQSQAKPKKKCNGQCAKCKAKFAARLKEG